MIGTVQNDLTNPTPRRLEHNTMQQVRIFKSIESEVAALEREVNAWIGDSGARVISITGNIAPQSGSPKGTGMSQYVPSDILLIVLYEA